MKKNIGLGLLIIVLMFISFQVGRYEASNLTSNEKMGLFNAGYRNGAYNVLAYLMECKQVYSPPLQIEHMRYKNLVRTYDGLNLDNEYPCTE